MKHDPLCKAASLWVAVIENGGSLPHKFIDYCPTCDLIAKVRADERNCVRDFLLDRDLGDWSEQLFSDPKNLK